MIQTVLLRVMAVSASRQPLGEQYFAREGEKPSMSDHPRITPDQSRKTCPSRLIYRLHSV
jgi:hypothetical protein